MPYFHSTTRRERKNLTNVKGCFSKACKKIKIKIIKEEARRRIKLENYVLTHSILEVRTVVGNMGKVKENTF